jgi:hypothetical protein
MTKKDSKDDLIGFQEFIEYKEKKMPKINKNASTGFELYSFIERDSQRLSKLLSLFEEKTFMLNTYPQDAKITLDLENEIILKKEALIKKFKNPTSQLNKNINDLLSNHFES